MLCCGNADTHVTYGLFVIVENAQCMDREKIEVSEFANKANAIMLCLYVFNVYWLYALVLFTMHINSVVHCV